MLSPWWLELLDSIRHNWHRSSSKGFLSPPFRSASWKSFRRLWPNVTCGIPGLATRYRYSEGTVWWDCISVNWEHSRSLVASVNVNVNVNVNHNSYSFDPQCLTLTLDRRCDFEIFSLWSNRQPTKSILKWVEAWNKFFPSMSLVNYQVSIVFVNRQSSFFTVLNWIYWDFAHQLSSVTHHWLPRSVVYFSTFYLVPCS